MSLSITGQAVVLANLARVIARAAATGKAIEGELKDVIAETAGGMVAVDTGETRDSITVTDTGVEVGGAAQFLEFGTYKMAAQPFFRPAMDEAADHDVSGIAQATLLGGL